MFLPSLFWHQKLTHSWHRCDSLYTEVLLVPSVWVCRIQLHENYIIKSKLKCPRRFAPWAKSVGSCMHPNSKEDQVMTLKANVSLPKNSPGFNISWLTQIKDSLPQRLCLCLNYQTDTWWRGRMASAPGFPGIMCNDTKERLWPNLLLPKSPPFISIGPLPTAWGLWIIPDWVCLSPRNYISEGSAQLGTRWVRESG